MIPVWEACGHSLGSLGFGAARLNRFATGVSSGCHHFGSITAACASPARVTKVVATVNMTHKSYKKGMG